MPIYPRRCTECNHEFDVLAPYSKSHADVSCEECGSPTVRQYYGAVLDKCGGTTSHADNLRRTYREALGPDLDKPRSQGGLGKDYSTRELKKWASKRGLEQA